MSQQITTTQSKSSLGELVLRFPLAAFFVLAFALTWPFMIADALGSYRVIPFRLSASGPGLVLALLMSYGPTFAALIVTFVISGWTGIRKLLSRLLIWRVGLRWYVVAILGPFLIFFAAIGVYLLLGGTMRPLPQLGILEFGASITILFLVQGLVNGEEIGWRGFALPRLQNRQIALLASLSLGLIWGLFHLPLFFTQGGGVGGNQASVPMLAFVAQILASSILATWIFNNTRGSLLLMYCFHASINTASQVFASASPDGQLFWIQGGLFCLAAVSVVVGYGAANLSRTNERVRE